MKSQILTKINNFTKRRLIEFSGILLVLLSFFLLASIITYSPDDPNFIYTPENTQIKNMGGFYGSVISDFLLQSIGLISILLVINFFYWGLKIISEKIINNFITKIFFTLIYIISGTIFLSSFHNNSYWLIDNGNGGFVGRVIKENIYYFAPIIENQYFIYSLLFLAIIFFVLSLSIKPNEIIKILLFPIILIKKISFLFKKNKKYINQNKDNLIFSSEQQEFKDSSNKNQQPILPFAENKNREVKNLKSIFKLPGINFLEKNND